MQGNSISREEFEASDCVVKTIRRAYVGGRAGEKYHLCTPCRTRVEDPSFTDLCEGAPHPRCESMAEGEVTIDEALDEFMDTVEPTKNCNENHIERVLELFKSSISRCWECTQCEYWEARNGGYEEAFASTHGVSWISNGIPSFCSWFIIRKCWMCENEKRRCYTIMSKLTNFLYEKEYMRAEEKKEIKKSLTLCRSVDSEKISKALQSLKEQGYWESLMQQSEDASDDVSEESYTIGDEMPLKVQQVTNSGWIFEYTTSILDYYDDGDVDQDPDDGVLLRLPEDVAKLGRKGMSISCMQLVNRGGIWYPENPYGDENVCANVYPPTS